MAQTQTNNLPTKPSFAMIMKAQADKISEVLPSFMRDKRDAFVRLAMVDIPRSPELRRIAQDSPMKIVAAIMDQARLGLMSGPLGHAYLVPFGDEVQNIIGYKGLIELARRGGEVGRVDADVIYQDDTFIYVKGDAPKFEHTPNLLSTNRTPDKIIAAYAFAYAKDGSSLGGTVMPRMDVEAVRQSSKSKNSPMWTKHWPEAAKKTAIRRASKLWPMCIELQEALHAEDERLESMPVVVQGPSSEPGAPSYVEPDLYGAGDADKAPDAPDATQG